MTPVVAVELLSYGFTLFGGSVYDVAPILKAALLLPFVWLPFECTKMRTRRVAASDLVSQPAPLA